MLLAIGCQNHNTVSKSKYNQAVLLGLVNAQNIQSQEIEIAGTWKQYTSNKVTSTYEVAYISSDLKGIGNWNAFDPSGTSLNAYSIVEFDNSTNTLYYSNSGSVYSSTSGYVTAQKYGKIVWTNIDNSQFYYCEIVYGKASLADAKASTTTADSSNLSTGCSNFSWTLMVSDPAGT